MEKETFDFHGVGCRSTASATTGDEWGYGTIASTAWSTGSALMAVPLQWFVPGFWW
jgi:hypothetical protein